MTYASFMKPCRQVVENRIDRNIFMLLFRQNHRITLYKSLDQPTYTCEKPVGTYDDQLFNCKWYFKTRLHNHIRDIIYFVTSNIRFYAKCVVSPECYRREKGNHIPSFPSIRPRDAILHPSSNLFLNQSTYDSPITAIDYITMRCFLKT